MERVGKDSDPMATWLCVSPMRSATVVWRAFLFIAACLLAAFNWAEAGERRPNILVIIVDDLAPVSTAFGGPVSTPALDRLAEQGFSFTNNFANVPVCGASRASMLSGLAPTAQRFLTFNSRLDVDAPEATSLPAFFKKNGWYTLGNGKVFDVINDSANSWSRPVWNPEDQWFSPVEAGERGEHLQKSYIQPVGGKRPPVAEKLAVEDDAYPDGRIARKSVLDIAKVSRLQQPFFMAVGFRKPHLPFNAPAKYWNNGEAEAAQLPMSWTVPAQNVPAAALHKSIELRMQYGALPLIGEPLDDVARELLAAYYAATRYVDAQVGRVLDALSASGVADNTIVLLTGDHGFFLGEHRMWTKHALFEPALRTPLVLYHPKLEGGKEIGAISDLLDIFPTLVDLAGMEVPPYLQGHSLRPLLEDPTNLSREEKPVSLSRWMNGESLRSPEFRYTRWHNAEDEAVAETLFDLQSDPHELINVVAAPEYADVLEQMRNGLFASRTGPVWSAELGRAQGFWKIMQSDASGIVMILLLYPIVALVAALFVIALIVWLVKRRIMAK
ncbi:MAG: sulfatase [Halioglobus sp.]